MTPTAHMSASRLPPQPSFHACLRVGGLCEGGERPERSPLAAGTVSREGGHLWRPVRPRAGPCVGMLIPLRRRAEIDELQAARICEEDVLWFDIRVAHALGVEECNCAAKLLEKIGSLLFAVRTEFG